MCRFDKADEFEPDPYRDTVTGWRKSRWVAAVATATVLTVQLAIPITRLGQHDVAERFGWQMFSAVRPPIEFVVHTEDGDVEVKVQDHFARVRGDLPVAVLLPPKLCEEIEGAESVTWDGNSYQC